MVEVNNLTSFPVKESLLEKLAESVIDEEAGNKNLRLSIALIGIADMKALNKRFLKKDYPTDVLSFEQEGFPGPYQGLGEVIICPSQAKANAEKMGVDFIKELCRVLIHGILHLFGYDHGNNAAQTETMRAKEEYYLKKYFAI